MGGRTGELRVTEPLEIDVVEAELGSADTLSDLVHLCGSDELGANPQLLVCEQTLASSFRRMMQQTINL